MGHKDAYEEVGAARGTGVGDDSEEEERPCKKQRKAEQCLDAMTWAARFARRSLIESVSRVALGLLVGDTVTFNHRCGIPLARE